jgi:hypothetical protein
MSTNDVRQQIIDYYRSIGQDPSFALATASRESNFNPNSGGTGTIRGLYQMTRALRNQYGIREGGDVAHQSTGFAKYENELRNDMTQRMGRTPTNSELYMGHHFGPYRASKMATGKYDPNTPNNHIFSPLEMQGNPHFARAGTIGNLTNQTLGDMDRRLGRYGEPPEGGPPGRGDPDNAMQDFSRFAVGYKEPEGGSKGADNGQDFSRFAAGYTPSGQAPQEPTPGPNDGNPGGLNKVEPLMPWLTPQPDSDKSKMPVYEGNPAQPPGTQPAPMPTFPTKPPSLPGMEEPA